MSEITERVTPVGSDLLMKLDVSDGRVVVRQLSNDLAELTVLTQTGTFPAVVALTREEQAALGEYLVRKANSEPRT